MASTADIFQQVRAAVDIVEVIGEHVALKRAGREFKGLCPFHEDHRPSMAVVPHKQIFHCFVCGTGGDVFKFVENYHQMGQGEALRMLAQRGGVKLPELPRGQGGGRGGQKEGPSQREQIAATNEWACGFFEKQLPTPAGAKGLAYLKSRGLTDETIAKFRLGWAPEGWTALVTAALKLGIRADALELAGLVKKRGDGSPYDIFRGRVIFPIVDATGGGGSSGRVIAFGGRVLEEKRDEAGNVVEAKYLNSPETRLFVKSESMYGLNHARQQIVRTRTAVVVEGYMDVIAAHQAGVTNVIATLGTALTPEHSRVLKNYAQTIVLVFDSDDAGFRAAERAMEVFVRTQLDIKLTNVPNGKDPCDFCMAQGADAFQKIIDAAPDALTYQWARLQKQFRGTDSLSAKQEAITQFMRFVAAGLQHGAEMDPVRRGLLFSKLAGMVGISVEEVGVMLKGLKQETRNTRHETAAEESKPEIVKPRAERVHVAGLKGLDLAEGWVLGSLLAEPVLYEKVRDEIMLPLFVRLHALAAVLIEFLENHAELEGCGLAEITRYLEEDPELVRQAIELERRATEWLDPNMSPSHVKMLAQSRGDRGLTLELVLRDSLKQLREERGEEDPGVTADLDGAEAEVELSEEERKLKELMGVVEKKRRAEDRGNVGWGGVKS